MAKKTLLDLQEMKRRGEKISWVTASDFPTATAAERGGVDMILIGDSSFMTQYGFPDTKSATSEIMCFLNKAVRKGAPNTFLVGDFPINTYNNPIDALTTALEFWDSKVDMIKLEGRKTEEVKMIVDYSGIPVCSHLGLIPQSSNSFKVYGKTLESFESLVEDALAMQEAGISALLLEAIPEEPALAIAKNLNILTLGIGAGRHLDGNLIIQNDLLGYYPLFRPTFVKCQIPYATCAFNASLKDVNDLQIYGKENPGADGFLALATIANSLYTQEVKAGVFPEPKHNYKIKPEELEILKTSKYWKE